MRQWLETTPGDGYATFQFRGVHECMRFPRYSRAGHRGVRGSGL